MAVTERTVVADVAVVAAVSKDKSASTITKYTSMLRRVVALTDAESIQAAVSRPTATHRTLTETYSNIRTLDGYVGLIVLVCNAVPNVASQTVRNKWSRLLDEVSERVQLAADNNTVSDKLRKKWIDYDSIVTKCEALYARLIETKGTDKEWQAVVLLAFYAHLPPKRADLGAVHILRCKTGTHARCVAECVKINACVLSPSKGTLVLNEYKTYDVYDKFVEKLPDRLMEIVTASLEAHPRNYLLCGINNAPLSVQSLSNRVVKVMQEYMGKGLSINDLRHIYITQKVSLDKMTTAQRKEVAASMMHSIDVQIKYARVV